MAGFIEFPYIIDPSSPITNRSKLWFGTDGLLRSQDENGTVTIYFSSYNRIHRDSSNATINDQFYQWNGDTSGENFTYKLPPGVQSRAYKIVNVGSGIIELLPNGSENLLGVNSAKELNPGDALIISYDSTDGWW